MADHCPFDASCILPGAHSGPCRTARRLYPIGTISPNGWRLMRTRKPHDCAECGQTIKANRGAWMRPAWPNRPGHVAYEKPEYLCQHGHDDRTGVEP